MLRRFCDRIYSLRNTRISVRQQKILQDKITDLQKMYLAYITCFTVLPFVQIPLMTKNLGLEW